VWLLFTVVAVEILITYSRLPARELYHVSGTGLEGGASRVVVFANFSTALVALAVLAIVADVLPRGALRGAAAGAAVLCATVFWPGVVKQADLDARPVNALAVIGVASSLALTLYAVRRRGLAGSGRQPGDRSRVVVAAGLLVVSLPWLAAELGFFLTGVPLLRRVFLTGTYAHGAGLPAVHHGHHHGADGLLLVLTALFLSRAVPSIHLRALRIAIAGYLSLMFCYGLGNVANDFSIEQVMKRGWTTRSLPSVLEPRASVAWGVIVAAALVLWAIAARQTVAPAATNRSSGTSSSSPTSRASSRNV